MLISVINKALNEIAPLEIQAIVINELVEKTNSDAMLKANIVIAILIIALIAYIILFYLYIKNKKELIQVEYIAIT